MTSLRYLSSHPEANRHRLVSILTPPDNNAHPPQISQASEGLVYLHAMNLIHGNGKSVFGA